MFKVAQRVAAVIRATDLPCDGVNLFVADGEAAHQSVFHCHIHIYPRLKEDGFGFKYDDRHFQNPPREELDKAAKLIRSHLPKS